MFKFLRRSHAPTILADCEEQLNRATGPLAVVLFGPPKGTESAAAVLERAVAAGLGEHETVKRLAFLQRLNTVNKDLSPSMKDALLAEAARYRLENTTVVQSLREQRELERLEQQGPRVMGHDQQGRGVYFQCEAEFKNKPGQLEIREDGLTFTGEVVIEIPWSNVVHAAKTTHTFQGLDYAALALLEGKRRTPTKFVSTRDYDATYAVEVTMRLWEQSKKQSPPI